MAVFLLVLPLRMPPKDFSASRSVSMAPNFRQGVNYVLAQPTIVALIIVAMTPSLFVMSFTNGRMRGRG